MSAREPVPKGYKETEVGVIPEEWEVKTFTELAAIDRGKFSARPRNDPKYYGGDIPFIQTGDVARSNGKISSYSQTLNEDGLRVSRLFPHGTLFFTIAANIGDVGVAEFSAACPDSLVAVLPRPNVEKIWLLFELAKRKENFENLASPGAQLNINLEKLRPYQLPLPPFAEQRAIAAALSDVDALIGALDALIAKKRGIKQAAMQQLLTGKTRLPGFSGEWNYLALGDLGPWKGGGTPSMSNTAYWSNGSIYWVSSSEMKFTRLWSTEQKITQQAVTESSTTLMPSRSILVVTRSGILRRYLPVALSMVPLAINQDIKALIPKDGVVSEYAFHAILANGPRILATCIKSGTTVESIELGWLKRFEISVPKDESEQSAIAEILSDMDAELAALESRREKTRSLKAGMMQELLTGRIRLV